MVWNRALAAGLRRNPLLRLELHPQDADHPLIRRSWQRLLAAHLEDRKPATLDSVAERVRRHSDWDQHGAPLELEV